MPKISLRSVSSIALVIGALLNAAIAHADGPPTGGPTPPAVQATRCLTQLLIVTGLAGDDSLDIGGDSDAVLVHEVHAGKFFVFSKEGYYVVDKPVQKTASSVSFAAVLTSGTTRYVWPLKNGRAQSQASGASVKQTRADITANKWAPLDDTAWAMVARITKLKLPMALASLQRQRDFSAKKHMTLGAALGHEDAYRYCQGISAGGAELVSFVESEYGKWRALSAQPVVFEKWKVERRIDHPEWRKCGTTKDCVIAHGPCGWPDGIAKSAAKDYASYTKAREDQINCDAPDDDEVARVACVAGQCVDPVAVPQTAWTQCAADSDCEVSMACDTPIAVSKRASALAGLRRYEWFTTVDGWDRCADGPVPVPASAHAKCVAKTCELSR